MAMKRVKGTVKTSVKDLIKKSFMKSPFPMAITRAKDGTYIEVNESVVNLFGLKRRQIIGRTSTGLGLFSAEQRNLFVDEISKRGFVKSFPVELKIKNHLDMKLLLYSFPIQMRREAFFVSVVSDVSNHKINMKKFKQYKLDKITLQDAKYVKAKLKHFPLTPRQQEIAMLCAAGDANRDIARKLCISEYTVKDHQKEIFRIIGIKNRSELFPKLLNMR